MQTQLELLLELSKRYGTDKDYVIASGGNSSFKTADHLWITASGSFLGRLRESDLLKLSRVKLAKLRSKTYETDSRQREEDVKNDLISTIEGSFTGVRPSVETSLHDLIEYSFVLHTHPTLVNGLLCSSNAEIVTRKIFGDLALYIGYHDPGFTLFKKVQEGVLAYRRERGVDPKLIFLQNHGIFVGGESPDEIINMYKTVEKAIDKEITIRPDLSERPVDELAQSILPGLQKLVSKYNTMFLKVRNNALIESYLENEQSFAKISKPFTPDIIVFCKSNYLYVNGGKNPETILSALDSEIGNVHSQSGYIPKVILVKNLGLISAADNETYSEIILDIFEDLMKISCYSDNFGGPHFMSAREISFIEDWEAEKYRYNMARTK